MIESAEGPAVVLHIEDDEQISGSVATLLRAEGYEIISAADGASALDYITQRNVHPDVLIVDFVLPGEMDGADVVQAICSSLRHPVPMILLSGQLSSASLPWLPGTPLFCAWKPFDAEVLLQLVASFAALGRFIRSRQPAT